MKFFALRIKTALRQLAVLAAMLLLVVLGAGCDEGMRKGDYVIEQHYADTDDGMLLALRRYRPETVSALNNPVICCHGLGYNMLFWDLDEDVSLPRYLARAGYDVWIVSLRGASPSSQPVTHFIRKLGRFNLDPGMIPGLQKRIANIGLVDWSVDDHINHDLPATIAFVKKSTGAQRVHWIGHSMGGMVMAGYLGSNGPERANEIKSFVGVGVPMVVFHPLSQPYDFLVQSEPAIQLSKEIVGTSTPTTFQILVGDIDSPLDRLFYNSRNVDGDVLRNLFFAAQEDISTSQMAQLIHMVRTEEFQSLDRKVNYSQAMSQIVTPTMLLAGTVDNMATPAAVKYAFRRISSRDKRFRLFGRVNGQKNDYGHDDLVIGKYAREEIYPEILKWLTQHGLRSDEKEMLLKPQMEQQQAEPAPAPNAAGVNEPSTTKQDTP